MSDSYREGAMPEHERIKRLEDAVARFSFRRWYEAWKWGANILLAGIGVGLLVGAAMAGNAAIDSSMIEVIEAREARREAARQSCVSACTNVGMSVGRVQVSTGEHPRAWACSCVSPRGRRPLWNDHQSAPSPCRVVNRELHCQLDHAPARVVVVDGHNEELLDVHAQSQWRLRDEGE